jgi:cell division transport system ATP-binding protein
MLILFNVSVDFNNKPTLKKISLRINDGEFAYLVGPSGAGKTTLLRTIYRDIVPESGIIQVGDFNSADIKKKEVPYLRRKIGIVFQDFKLLEDRSIFENVAFALRVTGVSSGIAKKKTLKALASVGLHAKRDHLPANLSGGEIQRASIARAMILNPTIILADEPTGNLDPETATEIFKLLKKINEQGTSILTATHNYRLIKDFPGKIFRMEQGRLVNSGTN